MRALLATILFIISLLTGCKAELTWDFTSNPAALCNDYTRAGFFHRDVNQDEQKWVIFLERGSLCQSNENCNRRYFQSYIRDRYSSEDNYDEHGDFDTELAWSETGGAGQSLTEVVNPLMTSIYCFRNETQYFIESDTDDLLVEGRDVLSSDCTENPTFCNHGHVSIPYCSSDLWLGRDSKTLTQNSSQTPCNCWDQTCFQYNPTSDDHQFTFRGQIIFQSVLETLDNMYNLQMASEIVLIGSSAGGIGVLNSARWVREEFPNVNISVIIDSAWFTNFRDEINQYVGDESGDDKNIFNVVNSSEICNDTRWGYPCCVVSQCIISGSNPTTGETYFPQDVPLFMITSIYDIFLLAGSLTELASVDFATIAGLSQVVLTTLGEYGGVLNLSLIDTASMSDKLFSYYATQCLQHTYLSTSTLQGLIGGTDIGINSDVVEFE